MNKFPATGLDAGYYPTYHVSRSVTHAKGDTMNAALETVRQLIATHGLSKVIGLVEMAAWGEFEKLSDRKDLVRAVRMGTVLTSLEKAGEFAKLAAS